MNVRLYVTQRLTAAVMVPLVAVHLAVIFYATRHGLTAADVLARTRGSIPWALFYGTFVVAAAIHASIGIRTVLTELGVTIDSDALAWVTAQLGADRISTRQEAEKLALYAGPGGRVELDAAMACVGDLAGLSLDDALFADHFVSLYAQRIHRSLHPRQQQFCRSSTNAGTLKR